MLKQPVIAALAECTASVRLSWISEGFLFTDNECVAQQRGAVSLEVEEFVTIIGVRERPQGPQGMPRKNVLPAEHDALVS